MDYLLKNKHITIPVFILLAGFVLIMTYKILSQQRLKPPICLDHHSNRHECYWCKEKVAPGRWIKHAYYDRANEGKNECQSNCGREPSTASLSKCPK
jgi:hypothetical protein